MTSLFGRNAQMALKSIKSTKLRSFLTMLGIVIGVASVITAVSLGEGIRREISGGLKTGGPKVINVRPGKLVKRDKQGAITGINYQATLGTSSLSDQDYKEIRKLPSIYSASPLATISGLATTSDKLQIDTSIIGVSDSFASLIGQKVSYGSFFSDDDTNKSVAVIGRKVAEGLFQENAPIGHKLTIRGNDFIVVGVFDDFATNLLNTVGDLNNAIFIPYETARAVSGNNISMYQILAESKEDSPMKASSDVTATLTDLHGGQADFAVLTQDETLELTNRTLAVGTSFVAGIAAISLIVGGIGIMNIMFVGVTERTREIGVRKSLGATNRQIYTQFLTESTIISLVGGILGVAAGLLTNFLLAIFTPLVPVATLQIVILAVFVASAVGILFGTAPAVKAARKDPIESLRYE